MKNKMLTLIGVLLCLSVSACGAPSNSDSAKSVNNEVKAESTQEAPKETVETQTETETETQIEENEEALYNIGDSAPLKDWEITVTDVQMVDSVSMNYMKFSPSVEDSKYAQVFVSVTNNGKQAGNFLPSFGLNDDIKTKILFGDGYEFSASNLLGYQNELHDSVINPLSSKDAEVFFTVPNSVADSEEQLLIQFSSGKETIKIKLR